MRRLHAQRNSPSHRATSLSLRLHAARHWAADVAAPVSPMAPRRESGNGGRRPRGARLAALAFADLPLRSPAVRIPLLLRRVRGVTGCLHATSRVVKSRLLYSCSSRLVSDWNSLADPCIVIAAPP